MIRLPVYMDNNSTTRVDPRVVEAMLPYFTEKFGNAASRSHAFGWEAESAVEEARGQVADLIGAGAKEIIFTSGATESDNLALKGVAKVYKKKGVLFHTDAVQAVGHVPIDVNEMGIDLLSLTAHKIHGPKGIGALYVRKKDPRVRLEPQIDGGGHERGMRSGTLAVPMIVGFGKACEIARKEGPDEAKKLYKLRERLR